MAVRQGDGGQFAQILLARRVARGLHGDYPRAGDEAMVDRAMLQRETYLGLDYYELRGWDGWRRHMPMVFIAHLFGSKPRRRFSVNINKPGPSPYIVAPTPLSDYVEAAVKLQNNELIRIISSLSFQIKLDKYDNRFDT
jgi:hypothetical protein